MQSAHQTLSSQDPSTNLQDQCNISAATSKMLNHSHVFPLTQFQPIKH